MYSYPLISIVLPTYNGEEFIKLAIQSIQQQTYHNWELIIVDDHSTDNTPEIIKKFSLSDSRISIIRHNENKKLPSALNTGFSATQGEFLTWTSDDNLYLPHALEEMVNFLETHPDIDFVYTDYSIIDENNMPIDIVKVAPINELVLHNIIGGCFLYRSYVQGIIGPYSQKMVLVEDYDYWFRVSNHFEISPLHKNLYSYRKHSESLTSTMQSDVNLAVYIVRIKHLPLLNWVSKKKKADAYLSLALLGQKLNDRKKIMLCLFFSAKNNINQLKSPIFIGLIILAFFGEKLFRFTQEKYQSFFNKDLKKK